MVAGPDHRIQRRAKSWSLHPQGPRHRALKSGARIPADESRYRADGCLHRSGRSVDGLGALESTRAREGRGNRAPADDGTQATRAAAQAGAIRSTVTSFERAV